MSLLLDTHVLLWALTDDHRLRPATRRVIVDPSNPVYVSAASAWELAIKSALGKVRLPGPPGRWLIDSMKQSQFAELPVSMAHALAVESLPRHHDDPFDRMLIAQAQVEGMTLVTADPRIRRYDVKLLKA